MAPNREVRSVSPAWWICCPFAFFINCRIHRLSIGSFSVSCYTTIELQPRCHPSFLMRTGDCGAALLPWQQALSHSPHIVWSVHVVPSKLARRSRHRSALRQDRARVIYLLLTLNPTTHTSFPFLLLQCIMFSIGFSFMMNSAPPSNSAGATVPVLTGLSVTGCGFDTQQSVLGSWPLVHLALVCTGKSKSRNSVH